MTKIWNCLPRPLCRRKCREVSFRKTQQNDAVGYELRPCGFKMLRTVRPHRAPSKIHQKVSPLHKKLLYFFIVAPRCRWYVKKKRKKC